MLVDASVFSLEREAKSGLTDRTQPKCSCPVQTWNVIVAWSEGIPTLAAQAPRVLCGCAQCCCVRVALGRLSQSLGPSVKQNKNEGCW